MYIDIWIYLTFLGIVAGGIGVYGWILYRLWRDVRKLRIEVMEHKHEVVEKVIRRRWGDRLGKCKEMFMRRGVGNGKL